MSLDFVQIFDFVGYFSLNGNLIEQFIWFWISLRPAVLARKNLIRVGTARPESICPEFQTLFWKVWLYTSYSSVFIPGRLARFTEVPLRDDAGLLAGLQGGIFGMKFGMYSVSLSDNSESSPSIVSSAKVSDVLGAFNRMKWNLLWIINLQLHNYVFFKFWPLS